MGIINLFNLTLVCAGLLFYGELRYCAYVLIMCIVFGILSVLVSGLKKFLEQGGADVIGSLMLGTTIAAMIISFYN